MNLPRNSMSYRHFFSAFIMYTPKDDDSPFIIIIILSFSHQG